MAGSLCASSGSRLFTSLSLGLQTAAGNFNDTSVAVIRKQLQYSFWAYSCMSYSKILFGKLGSPCLLLGSRGGQKLTKPKMHGRRAGRVRINDECNKLDEFRPTTVQPPLLRPTDTSIISIRTSPFPLMCSFPGSADIESLQLANKTTRT